MLSGHFYVFFWFFPVFTRQIARYPLYENGKTSSKGIPKSDPSKI